MLLEGRSVTGAKADISGMWTIPETTAPNAVWIRWKKGVLMKCAAVRLQAATTFH